MIPKLPEFSKEKDTKERSGKERKDKENRERRKKYLNKGWKGGVEYRKKKDPS